MFTFGDFAELAAARPPPVLPTTFWRRAVEHWHAAGVSGDRPDPGEPEHPRSWTVDEANAALGWVGEVVARAQELWQDYRRHAIRSARLVRQNGHGLVPADPAPIQGCIDELGSEGIVLRDLARGLVDFPAQAPGGRWFWLCWLAGEDEVAWWHWPEDGFGGRTPLTEPPG